MGKEGLNKKDFPKIIKEVGFDFDWDERKVWALKYPIEEINIGELTWHFDIPFHSVYNLSSSQIIKNPKKYKEEYKRTMNSNLDFPIDIMHNKGRWLILDGLHRLIKANILGMTKVKVRKIPRSEIPNILKEVK
jgi:hypothetical protein